MDSIGTSTNKFNGTINGDNYTISNLIIDNQTDNFTGFFRFVSGTISDLKFEDAYIRGYERVGLLSGKQTSGSISRIEIDNLAVIGLYSKSGGIIGESFWKHFKDIHQKFKPQMDKIQLEESLEEWLLVQSIYLLWWAVAGNNKVGGLVET